MLSSVCSFLVQIVSQHVISPGEAGKNVTLCKLTLDQAHVMAMDIPCGCIHHHDHEVTRASVSL